MKTTLLMYFVMMEKILNYINGNFVAPLCGNYLDNVNPSTGKTILQIPDSDEKDVAMAVDAAQTAFPLWSQTSVEVRSQYLRKLAAKIRENLSTFAEMESIDSGKPMSLAAAMDIPRSISNFEFFADAMTQFHGESFQTDHKALNTTVYSPLGVVACISPWNLPLYLLSWKLAPALVSGNTVVAKPSELTPLTARFLAKMCDEIGLPPGVLNILHGLGPKVGAPLVENLQIKAVSFTGSTATGRAIANSTASQFKKLSLEMGGKNANIIFADCDFEKALATTVRSSFLNQGQICLCGSRIFVEKSIYSKFVEAFVEKTKALKQGNPLSPGIDQGALVSKGHMEKVLSYIELAKKEGGKILIGGRRAQIPGENSEGFFVEPTIIENLDFQCRTNQEEIFGPVVTITPFEDVEKALEMANSTKYGLSATVWTQNLSTANFVSSKLETGIVWINTWMLRDLRTPFGGVKESGMGREGGADALRFFSEVKNICIGL